MSETSAVDSGLKPQRDWWRATLVGVAVLTVSALAFLVVLTSRDERRAPATSHATGASQLPVIATSAPEPAAVNSVRYSVNYQLTGPANVWDITYVAQGSDIEQEQQSDLPWAKDIARMSTRQGPGYLTISARNEGEGTLTCRIRVNGSIIAENSVSGRDSVVRCAAG
jgi:hypothetical protein